MNTSIFQTQCTHEYNSVTCTHEWEAKPVDCFWVEATLSEVYSYFFNTEEEIIPLKRCVLRLLDNPEDDSNFYFWVAKDLSRVWQSFAAFPYSAMNDEKINYLYFPKIEIKSLQELKSIDIEKLRKLKR